MGDGETRPDRLTLDEHLQSTRFLAGVEEGRWEVLDYQFPQLVVRVTGTDLTGQTTFAHDFRLVCDDFPEQGPFVERWNFKDGALPPPPKEGSPGWVDAMKQWGPGGIYRAWQRTARDHNSWADKRPDDAWHRDRHLTFIMERLYALVCEQAAWLATRAAA